MMRLRAPRESPRSGSRDFATQRRAQYTRTSNCRGSKRQSRNECTTRNVRVSRQAKMMSQRKKMGETKFPRR